MCVFTKITFWHFRRILFCTYKHRTMIDRSSSNVLYWSIIDRSIYRARSITGPDRSTDLNQHVYRSFSALMTFSEWLTRGVLTLSFSESLTERRKCLLTFSKKKEKEDPKTGAELKSPHFKHLLLTNRAIQTWLLVNTLTRSTPSYWLFMKRGPKIYWHTVSKVINALKLRYDVPK